MIIKFRASLDASGCRTCDLVSVRVDRVMMIFFRCSFYSGAILFEAVFLMTRRGGLRKKLGVSRSHK